MNMKVMIYFYYHYIFYEQIKACFDCYLRLLEKRVGEGRVYEEDKINATQPEF